MARPLSRQLLAVLAGFVLLGSVVACGGNAGSGLVPGGAGGAASSSSSTGAPSVSTADGKHGDEDCDGRKSSSSSKSGHDDDDCTPAPTASPTNGGGGSTTITTYQTIRPLALYSGSNVIDFLVTPVSFPQTLIPLNSGLQKTDQFTVPMTCAVPAVTTPQPFAAGKRAAVASATPPPTPTPTNLPVSNCVIVAYAGTSTTAIPVTGPASIDGANLIFPATSPGVNYTIGVSYTFYVAIATTTVVPGSPSPSPSVSPCAKNNDKDHGNGHDGDRHEDDHGNHKDCGHHYGDDDDGDGGHHH